MIPDWQYSLRAMLMWCDSTTDGIVRMDEDMSGKPCLHRVQGFLYPKHISRENYECGNSRFFHNGIYRISGAVFSSFARMDLSDFPALVGTFAFGPVMGVLIELVENVLQLLSISTRGIGELANFLMGASFVFTAGLIYKRNKKKECMDWMYCRKCCHGNRSSIHKLLYPATIV